jgi:hypothetical protein
MLAIKDNVITGAKLRFYVDVVPIAHEQCETLNEGIRYITRRLGFDLSSLTDRVTAPYPNCDYASFLELSHTRQLTSMMWGLVAMLSLIAEIFDIEAGPVNDLIRTGRAVLQQHTPHRLRKMITLASVDLALVPKDKLVAAENGLDMA